jgi:hypothetical protein
VDASKRPFLSFVTACRQTTLPWHRLWSSSIHFPKPTVDNVICSKLLIKLNLTISIRKKCSQSFVGLLLCHLGCSGSPEVQVTPPQAMVVAAGLRDVNQPSAQWRDRLIHPLGLLTFWLLHGGHRRIESEVRASRDQVMHILHC